MILVTGMPRSGTKYTAELLCAFGLKIGHEWVAKDGISAWVWAVDDPNPPWWNLGNGRATVATNRPAWDTYQLIHVLRHPLDCIASVLHTAFPPNVEEYLSRHCVTFPSWSRIDNIGLTYLQWNRIIQAQAPEVTFHVEKAPEALAAWLGRTPPEKLPPTNVNTRTHPPVRPEDFRSEVRDALEAFCEANGYELDRTGAKVAPGS